jgi:hypothetical protein
LLVEDHAGTACALAHLGPKRTPLPVSRPQPAIIAAIDCLGPKGEDVDAVIGRAG